MDAEITCQINGKLEKLNVNGVNVAEDVTMDFDLVYASKDSRMNLDFSMSLRHGALYIEPGGKHDAVELPYLHDPKVHHKRMLSKVPTVVHAPIDQHRLIEARINQNWFLCIDILTLMKGNNGR